MEKLRLNVVSDGSPFSFVAQLEGQNHPGLYLPPGAVESLKELLRRAERGYGDDGSMKSLFGFLDSVLAPHRAFTHPAAIDTRALLEKLRKMAAQVGGGGNDDGPKRA
jgi:hypothetical protein